MFFSLPHDQDCHEMWSKKRKKVLREQQKEAAAASQHHQHHHHHHPSSNSTSSSNMGQHQRNGGGVGGGGGGGSLSNSKVHELYISLCTLQAKQPAQQMTPDLIATTLNIRNDEANFYAIAKLGSQMLSSHLKDKVKSTISQLCSNTSNRQLHAQSNNSAQSKSSSYENGLANAANKKR